MNTNETQSNDNQNEQLSDLPLNDERAEATKGTGEPLTLNGQGFSNDASAQKSGTYTWSYINKRPRT